MSNSLKNFWKKFTASLRAFFISEWRNFIHGFHRFEKPSRDHAETKINFTNQFKTQSPSVTYQRPLICTCNAQWKWKSHRQAVSRIILHRRENKPVYLTLHKSIIEKKNSFWFYSRTEWRASFASSNEFNWLFARTTCVYLQSTDSNHRESLFFF